MYRAGIQCYQFISNMTDWAEPSDFNEWVKRILSLRPLLILILVSALFILELRFDWMERLLGISPAI